MRLENINDFINLSTHNQSRSISKEITKSTSEVRDKTSHVSHDQTEVMVEKLNDFIEPLRTNLRFQLHEKLNEYYVEVVNPITNEVIKEVPPQKNVGYVRRYG